MTQRVVLLL